MENIFLELLKRSQNIKAKYSERINSIDQEIEKLLIDLQKVEQKHKKKRKHNKEEDEKSKKEINELKETLSSIEKQCEESSSESYNSSDSSSSSSSSSESSSSSSDSSDSTTTSSSSYSSRSVSRASRSTSSGSRLSLIEDHNAQKINNCNAIVATGQNQDHEESSSTQKEKNTSKTQNLSSTTPENYIPTPRANGLFEYLFYKFKRNPIKEHLIEISGNSFDEYEQNLLQNVIDPKWNQNHWLSKNVANSSITIKFNHFMVKAYKYRIRVGCTNGLGRFNSWEIEGITKEKQKIILDKVENCSEITRNHSEAEFPIHNDSFICSIRIMMRGKNTDNNYKMRFRNFELFGDIITE